MDKLSGNWPSSSMNAQSFGGGNFQDVAGLDDLRQQAQQDDKAALQKVAKQFEGMFMQMLFKSMRQANEAFESDSPLNSNSSKTYRQMYDQQMALDLSGSGSLGLAELIVQQLDPQNSNVTPASTLRTTSLSMAAMDKERGSGQADNNTSIKRSKAAIKAAENQPQSFDSPKDFVDAMMPYAKTAAKALGSSPLVMVAQAALETGWGQKVIRKPGGESSHNLFNIKADQRWDGPQARVKTLEFEGGVAVRQQANFRAYDDYESSFSDYVDFLQNSSRYQGALDNVSNPASFLHSLQQAGYATDPQYSNKILGVLKHVTEIVKGSE